MKNSIYYSEPVFRPPSEARSLLIQATVGCTFRCTFCIPYRQKKFLIRPFQEIKEDLIIAKKIYGEKVEKIFLLDGNAFIMKPERQIEIGNYAYSVFPNLKRISAYAHAKDILRKSDIELTQIKNAGINMVYLGIETGWDALLTEINKQTSPDELAEAAQKLHRAGITLSGTVILGLAGSSKQLSETHAIETAKLINRMNPPDRTTWYISALTLMLPQGTPIAEKVARGDFKPISSRQALEEMKIILENLSPEIKGLVWRSNHASNYLPLKGNLIEDRENLLETIEFGLANPQSLRAEFYRGL